MSENSVSEVNKQTDKMDIKSLSRELYLTEEKTKMHLQALMDSVEMVLNGELLGKHNLLKVAMALMYVTEQFQVDGKTKKRLLLKALQIFINKIHYLDDTQKNVMYMMVETVVEQVVDAKHEDDKGRLKQLVVQTATCCFGLFTKQK